MYGEPKYEKLSLYLSLSDGLMDGWMDEWILHYYYAMVNGWLVINGWSMASQ